MMEAIAHFQNPSLVLLLAPLFLSSIGSWENALLAFRSDTQCNSEWVETWETKSERRVRNLAVGSDLRGQFRYSTQVNFILQTHHHNYFF